MDGEQLLKAAKNNLASSLNLLTHLEVKSLQESFAIVRRVRPDGRGRKDCQTKIRIQGSSKLPRKEFNFGHLSLPWLLFSQPLLRLPASKTVLLMLIAGRAMHKIHAFSDFPVWYDSYQHSKLKLLNKTLYFIRFHLTTEMS